MSAKERDKKHKELQKQVAKEREFAQKLVLLKNEAGELGLFRTMQKIEIPIKEVGWEIADRIKKHHNIDYSALEDFMNVIDGEF